MLEDLEIFKGGGIIYKFIEAKSGTRALQYNTLPYVAIRCHTIHCTTRNHTLHCPTIRCHTLPYVAIHQPDALGRSIHKLSTAEHLSRYISFESLFRGLLASR